MRARMRLLARFAAVLAFDSVWPRAARTWMWLRKPLVWQEYDLHPHFPVLNRFFDLWRDKLEARLHSVTVAHSRLIKPAEIKSVDGIFQLH
jgi:uncharacterized protein Usg